MNTAGGDETPAPVLAFQRKRMKYQINLKVKF